MENIPTSVAPTSTTPPQAPTLPVPPVTAPSTQVSLMSSIFVYVKIILIVFAILGLLGAGAFYFLIGSDPTSLKGSFTGDTAPITGEAAPAAITSEAKPADTKPTTAPISGEAKPVAGESAPVSGEAKPTANVAPEEKPAAVPETTSEKTPNSDSTPAAIVEEKKSTPASETTPTPAPVETKTPAPAPVPEKVTPVPAAKPQSIAIKTITASNASVKPGMSTTFTFKGSNLSSMVIASSGKEFTFTSNANITLTISLEADITFSDLVISSDGTTATVKASVGDKAFSGSYGVNYFDISLSKQSLGTIKNVITIL